MKKRLIPLILIVVVAAVAFAAWRWFGDNHNGGIRVSGNIELTEVNISFKIPGKLVERAADEGDSVKRGMVVARLDQEQLLAQLDRARAALAAAQSLRTQLDTSIRYQAETVEGTVAARQADLRQAEARLAELLAGSRSQEKDQARAAVERTQAEYDRAAKDFERAKVLIKNEDISAADFDQFRTRFETAGASLKQAREQLALVLEGPRQENIEAARAQLAQTRAALRLAEAQRLELQRRKQEIATREAEIAQRKAEIALIESQLNDSIAVSPIDGVVLVKGAEPGEVLAAGTTVLTVGDLGHPWVRAYISETDLGRVKIGAKVKVTTDSFPGKVYWGRVTYISSEAEFTPKQIQTPEERAKLVYRIKVDVDNANGELKSNMPADAELVL
jgi:HlyD family secretion protein